MSYLTLLALLPGFLIIVYIFRKDRMEQEPISLIIKLIVLGAVSCIPAAFLEGQVEKVMPAYPEGSFMYAFTTAFFSAALIEETCKFLFMRLGSWKNNNFNCTFDGVVYGVATAIGFACLENVTYVMYGGIQVALTRAVLAVPLHAFCGAFMGAFYGRARQQRVNRRRGRARVMQLEGLGVAMLVHGTYDTFAMWDSNTAYVLLLVFVGFMYVIAVRMVNRLSAEDEWISTSAEFVPSYDTPDMKRISSVNGMSIASLVCGVISFLSFCIFLLPSVLAVIFGIIGNRNSRNGMATAGIVLGGLSLALNLFLLGGVFL